MMSRQTRGSVGISFFYPEGWDHFQNQVAGVYDSSPRIKGFNDDPHILIKYSFPRTGLFPKSQAGKKPGNKKKFRKSQAGENPGTKRKGILWFSTQMSFTFHYWWHPCRSTLSTFKTCPRKKTKTAKSLNCQFLGLRGNLEVIRILVWVPFKTTEPQETAKGHEDQLMMPYTIWCFYITFCLHLEPHAQLLAL